MSRLFCSAVICMFITASLAFPNLFVEYHASSCQDHPAQGYLGHGKPSLSCQDTDVQLADVEGKQTFCPGSSYILQVIFSEPRHFLLTSENAVLPSDDCYGYRYVWGDGKGRVASKTLEVQIPCGTAGNLRFKVTSAASPTDNYHQCELFYSLSANCSLNACANRTSPNPADVPSGSIKPSSPTLWSTPSTSASQQRTLPACQSPCPKFYASGYDKCQSSNYGYSCSKVMEELTLHWAISSCVPTNKCTQEVSWLKECTSADSGVLLHVMAEASVSGYIGVSFASKSTSMIFADAVIGYITQDGKSSISAFPISQYQINQYSRYSTTSGFLSYSGIVRLANGRLMLCFARRMRIPTAVYSPDLTSNDSVNINWAVSSSPRIGKHDKARSTKVNLGTGELIDLGKQHASVRKIHGVLSILDWGILMPLAVVFARHKQQFSDRIGDSAIWILVHVWLQVLAFTCLVTGTIVLVLPSKLRTPHHGWSTIHGVLGLVLIAGNFMQLLSAVFRPNQTSPYKKLWRRVHASTGVFLFALAVCNIGIGIHMIHMYQGHALWAWVVPLLLCYVFIAAVELTLSRRRAQVQDFHSPAVVYIGSRLPRVGSMQMLMLQRSQSNSFAPVRPNLPIVRVNSEVFMPLGRRRSGDGSGTITWSEEGDDCNSDERLSMMHAAQSPVSNEVFLRHHLPPVGFGPPQQV